MSVRNAVAEREGAQLPATVTPKAIAEQRIKAQLPTFSDVLPPDFDSNRFMTVTLTAIKSKPELLECFATKEGTASLVLACIQAASLGIEPDTPLGDAWLLPRNVKGDTGWHKEAELSLSYRGLSKLALAHPDVLQIVAGTVREGDHFEHYRGMDKDHLEHRPGSQRGDLTHAYAIMRLRNGATDYVVLDREDVERAKASSPGANGNSSPWRKHEAAQWQKTAVRRLCTSTPYRTVKLGRALEGDEQRLAAADGQIIAIDEAPDFTLPAIDQGTGEVLPDDEYIEGGEPFGLGTEASS